MERNLKDLCGGQIDVVLFTSANQVTNLLTMAERHGSTAELRAGLRNVAVASIGPTTSEHLRDCEIGVDIQPEHSKMGHLV